LLRRELTFLRPTAKAEWKRLVQELFVLGIVTVRTGRRWPPRGDSLPRSASSGIEAAELIALPLLASGSGPARSRCDP
jgi:hypothetical protein